MAPHATIRRRRQTRINRSWWKPQNILNNRIVECYNLYIAPENGLAFTKVITQNMLTTVFVHYMGSKFFSLNQHFVTKTRFVISTSDNSGIITCKECRGSADDTPINESTVIQGNEHFTLPSSMVFSILELQSVWCKLCGIQLFTWFDEDECSHNDHMNQST